MISRKMKNWKMVMIGTMAPNKRSSRKEPRPLLVCECIMRWSSRCVSALDLLRSLSQAIFWKGPKLMINKTRMAKTRMMVELDLQQVSFQPGFERSARRKPRNCSARNRCGHITK